MLSHAYTEIQNLIKELPDRRNHRRREYIGNVCSVFRNIFYDYEKYPSLTEAPEQKSILNQIDSYTNDLKHSSFPDGKAMYAWVSEQKLSFCENKEEATKIFNEILSTYRTIFKDKPKWAHWLIRINYLNFLSHNDHEDCLEIGEYFFSNKDTFERKPKPNELAKLYNILAIEYKKKCEFTKSFECINKGKSSDPNYPGIYSTAGHLYLILANTETNIEKSKQFHEKSKENFNKAMELNRGGFNHKHPLDSQPSQAKISVQTHQPNVIPTPTTTPTPKNAWNGANLAKCLLSQEGSASVPANQQSRITKTTTTTVKEPSITATTTTTTLFKQPSITATTTTTTPVKQTQPDTITTSPPSSHHKKIREEFEKKYPQYTEDELKKLSGENKELTKELIEEEIRKDKNLKLMNDPVNQSTFESTLEAEVKPRQNKF